MKLAGAIKWSRQLSACKTISHVWFYITNTGTSVTISNDYKKYYNKMMSDVVITPSKLSQNLFSHKTPLNNFNILPSHTLFHTYLCSSQIKLHDWTISFHHAQKCIFFPTDFLLDKNSGDLIFKNTNNNQILHCKVCSLLFSSLR